MKYLFIVFLIPFVVKGQIKENDSLKLDTSNPIIFGEMLMGVGSSENFGFVLGASLNYQRQKHLYTIRYTGFDALELSKIKSGSISHLLIFPAYVDVEKINEYSFLYGRRHIYDNVSFSYSSGIGIAYRQERQYIEDLDKYSDWISETNFGIPIELNIKWFKSRKQRLRIPYGLIPVGNKKIAFGRSIGFKLFGHISKNSYVGLGLTWGFGIHKDYSEVEENP